ncbi:hypothetical protein BS78_10G123700 [Paspalum vaginatum]|nr:hypothetical protein BS78_10G123700 [Paspalum vaginatum]
MESEEQLSNVHMSSKSPDEQPAQQQCRNPSPSTDEAELLWKLRKYLILLAILAAAITYQAGLAPPGGFWQDNQNGHIAGDIVLRITYPKRYLVFFYCNTTAFGASLIVLLLLLVKELSHKAVWLRALQFAMVLGLLGLMGAYAAGSCREVRTSIYIWVLLVGIFAYVTLHVIFFRHLAPEWLRDIFLGIRRYWKEFLNNIFKNAQSNSDEQEPSDKLEELERNRSLLLVLATLAATVTFVAGLNPPGGFWPDNKPNHLAGDPVLRDHYPRRFKAFLFCNATSFAGSLVIIIMLLSNTAVDHVVKSNALRLCVLVSLFGLMGAYAAGSCRDVRTSIYVFSLVGAVLLYLVLQWIEPIVTKPKCIEKSIGWMRKKKTEVLQKLSSFIMKGSGNPERTSLSEPNTQHPSNNSMLNNFGDAKDDLQKLRTYLLLLGILAATVTYQAGLNPPGGFWADNNGHIAGDPILETIYPRRYKAFFYCNATAFVASLVIITLLQSQLITIGAMKRHILQTAMILDLFGLMGAYAAGSSRKFSTSVYVFILVLLVFTYIVLHVLLSVALKTRLKGIIDCFRRNDAVEGIIDRFKSNVAVKWIVDCLRRNDAMDNEDEGQDLEKRRKFLMLLAILAASITYQAGISPPGGFWSDNNGHQAGDPVFHDEFPRRYRVFFYFNATAFMASLVVIMLLVSKRLFHKGLEGYALHACVLVDLISLMGAFAAGSCRKVSTSFYVILVVVAVSVYVMIQVLVLTFAKDKVNDFLERTFGIRSLGHEHISINHERSIRTKKRTEHKWRKDLMLIGTLAVTVTYQAGLLPPGGFWPDDQVGHFAGDPILHDTHPTRFKIFFYCNATAFMASMVMVILLLNNTISKYRRSLLAMKTAMVLDLLGLLGAYAAGSCRKFKTSAYIFALVIAVFIYIVIHVLLSFDEVALLVRKKGEKWMPCLKKMWALIETDPSNLQRSAGKLGEVSPAV